MREPIPARLVLADGTIFRGRGFGARGESGGEAVFNTCLSGYQEIITDPSYCGQIVVMTSPLIGNYGVNVEDEERDKPFLSGFVVRELSKMVSNFRQTESLHEYLERHGIVAMDGVDTRMLTRKLREGGAMRALITTETMDDAALRDLVTKVPDMEGRDLVTEVTRGRRLAWEEGFADRFTPELAEARGSEGSWDYAHKNNPHVVVIDYGAKANIFRSLVECGFKVTVLPASATAAEIMAENPQGLMLSNGPGDPRALDGAIATVKELVGKLPIFGICLGHQILCAALGADIFKLKFGHHGGNQPVQDLQTGRVEITSQNHGFAVDRESVEKLGGKITHVHLNDNTVAGFEMPHLNAMSVQYHPEACPGPHDSLYLFRRFQEMVTKPLETA